MTPNLVATIEAGFDRSYPEDLYVADARAALESLLEQLETHDRERDEETQGFLSRTTELKEQLEAAQSENRLLREEIRIRETSQIPMVPRAAAERMAHLPESPYKDELVAALHAEFPPPPPPSDYASDSSEPKP